MRLLCHDVMVDVSLWRCSLSVPQHDSAFLFLSLFSHIPLTSHLFCFHLYIHLFCFLTVCPRCDITAVLLYVEQLLWSVCESPEALVHSDPSSEIAIIEGGSDWPYQIHSLCDQLLTVLITVTAPLSLLYRLVYLHSMFLWFNLNFSKIGPKHTKDFVLSLWH